VFVTKCIVIALLYHCKTVLLYRSTLYIQNVMREETRVSVPIICVLHFRVINMICCLLPATLSLRLARTKLSLDALSRSAAALSLRTQLIPNALSLMCFHKDQLIRIRTDATLKTCIFFGRIAALRPHRAGFTFGG
jgi:hypothetical protein